MNILKRIRKAKKMTQVELASLLGVTDGMVSHIEKGIRGISSERAIAWAPLLGVSRATLRPDLWGRVK